MIIHVTEAGDTASSIAARYGVALENLLADNGLTQSDSLVVGEALVVQVPARLHTVRQGETLSGIAADYGLSLRQLLRNNYRLKGRARLVPGEELVIAYEGQGQGGVFVTNSYAYPYIAPELLRAQLPYLSCFTPFTYGITQTGGLVNLEDTRLLSLAREYGAMPLMHLSTLTEQGNFSNQRASLLFNDPEAQARLVEAVLETMGQKGYQGLDADFEFIYPEERYDYVAFLQNLRLRLNSLGYPLISALAPKTSDTQQGVLYQGHDYAGIGAAANGVLLMTYEWGYTYSAPMAVAPLNSVRRVAEYALTRIPPEKLLLGIPTYGYDWTLPYVQGNPGAPSLSPVDAMGLARRYSAEIHFDDAAQSPWFRYTTPEGVLHEVWFEDARSIRAKLALAAELGFLGLGYWNAMRDFPQNWVTLNNLYRVEDQPRFPGMD